VFNDSNSFMPHYLLGLTGIDEDPATAGSQNTPAGFMANPTGYGAEDTQLSDKVMTMWSNFAKRGNPSIKGVIEWPPYTPENDSFLKITPALTVETGLQTAFELPQVED
jgi:para-nitrobenzyl esterase